MPRIRDLLIHANVEIAGKKRKCARKPREHSISKGGSCLVIKGGPRNAPKSYCRICAEEILDAAETRLTGFRQTMSL